MRADGIIASVILVIASALLLFFAPTTTTLLIVIVMTIMVIADIVFQIIIPVNYSIGLKKGIINIKKVKSMQISDMWAGISQLDSIFAFKQLDEIYREYREAVNSQKVSEYSIVSDIGDMICEEELESRTHKEIFDNFGKYIAIIGVLGTVLSLVLAITKIKIGSLSSLVEALKSVVLGGIAPYYPLIAGIVLCVLLGIINNIIWETVVSDINAFVRCFHNYVIGTVKSQQYKQQSKFYKDVIDRLNFIIRKE